MKSVGTILAALIPVVLLAAGLLYWDNWRPSAPTLDSGTQAVGEQMNALSCRVAFLAAPGVTPGTTCLQLQDLSLRLFGATSSRTLTQACRDGRLLPADEALFFPSRSLCGDQSASACLTTCSAQR
jgi:hypothetical protein